MFPHTHTHVHTTGTHTHTHTPTHTHTQTIAHACTIHTVTNGGPSMDTHRDARHHTRMHTDTLTDQAAAGLVWWGIGGGALLRLTVAVSVTDGNQHLFLFMKTSQSSVHKHKLSTPKTVELCTSTKKLYRCNSILCLYWYKIPVHRMMPQTATWLPSVLVQKQVMQNFQPLWCKVCQTPVCSPQLTHATVRDGGASYVLTCLRYLPKVWEYIVYTQQQFNNTSFTYADWSVSTDLISLWDCLISCVPAILMRKSYFPSGNSGTIW